MTDSIVTRGALEVVTQLTASSHSVTRETLEVVTQLTASSHSVTREALEVVTLLITPAPVPPVTELLLHFDGADQSTTITDSGASARTMTPSGSAKIVTAQGKFDQSLSIDGTAGYVTTPYLKADFDWWTQDFTIEAFVYISALGTWDSLSHSVMVGNMTAASNVNYWSFGPDDAGKLSFHYYNGGNNHVLSTSTLGTGAWHHIAMTHKDGNILIFAGGVLETTTAVSGTPQSSETYDLTIGQYQNIAMDGYVDELRISTGTAIYTETFTPPIAPFAGDPATAKVTQLAGEVLYSPPRPTAKVTQQAGEVLYSPPRPTAKVTQALVEILYTPAPRTTVSHSIVNPDAETGDGTGWTYESGTALAARNTTSNEGTYSFWFGAGTDGKAYQDIDLLADGLDPQLILDDKCRFVLGYAQASYSTNDKGYMSVRFLEADQSTVIGSETTDTLIAASTTWQDRSLSVDTPVNARFARIAMHGQRFQGTNNDAYFDTITAETSYADVAASASTSVAKATGYAILQRIDPAGVSIKKATGYAILQAIVPSSDVAKATSYAVLREKAGVAKVSKATAYAVLREQPPRGRISKATAYAVLREFDKTKELNVRKISVTAILKPEGVIVATSDSIVLTETPVFA